MPVYSLHYKCPDTSRYISTLQNNLHFLSESNQQHELIHLGKAVCVPGYFTHITISKYIIFFIHTIRTRWRYIYIFLFRASRLYTVFSFCLFYIVSFPNFHTVTENWVKRLRGVALPITHPVIRVRGFWLPHWVTARSASPVVSLWWPTRRAELWPQAAQFSSRLALIVQPCPPEWLLHCRSFLLCGGLQGAFSWIGVTAPDCVVQKFLLRFHGGGFACNGRGVARTEMYVFFPGREPHFSAPWRGVRDDRIPSYFPW